MTSDVARTATARVLRRTGFGATGSAIDAAMAVGTRDYLKAALATDQALDLGQLATPAPSIGLVLPAGKNATDEQRKARRAELRDGMRTLSHWWVRRMSAVEQPLTEKLTFCWHNHFATASTKVKQAALMLAQNETLRADAVGNFSVLSAGMLTDPAMLVWLDGRDNVAGSPNENLSREFIELFALGHDGGYTEQDVRESARALTGWRITGDGSAEFVAKRHDADPKTIFGVTGDLDQQGFCDAVLAQPAAARHVVSRLYGRLVSDQPPSDAVLDQLSDVLRPAWDISALIDAMVGSDDFAAAQGQLVIGPVEWVVGLVRSLEIPLAEDGTVTTLLRVLRALGQLPFDPPSVAGWPAGPAWLSTAAADIRMRAAIALIKQANLDPVAGASSAERVDAAGYLLGVPSWSPRSRKVLQDLVSDPAALVAVASNTAEYLTN